MVDWLRALPPGVAHEEARAAIGAATMYLHETFGEVHTSAIMGAIVKTIPAGGEIAPVETPPLRAPMMATLVRLTLRRLHSKQGGVDRGTESLDALHICAEVGDDVTFDLHLPVVLGRLESGRQGDGDETVETADGRRCVEKDHRCSADIACVGDGRDRLELVDHVMHSVQGEMRVGVMPPAQTYGVMRSLPSLQGEFR